MARKNKLFGRMRGVVIMLAITMLLYVAYKFLCKNNELFANPPIKGYYLKSWLNQPAPTSGWDFGIYFSGESPIPAIDNNITKSKLITSGKKILNLGGGENTGIWSGQADFDHIKSNLTAIKTAGWDGLCFDIEVCATTTSIDFIQMFSDCFAACKNAGLLVIVTTSHTMPFGCTSGDKQGQNLVNSWISNKNIDYISPQLYSAGDKLEPTSLVEFSSIANKILPSIPYESDWNQLNANNIYITPAGYLVWNIPAKPAVSHNYCGVDWPSANSTCSVACPSGLDSDCPSGQKCYLTNDCPKNYCGVDWPSANSTCSVPCASGLDSDCPSGQKCFSVNCPKVASATYK